jgi:hypothetical protein
MKKGLWFQSYSDHSWHRECPEGSFKIFYNDQQVGGQVVRGGKVDLLLWGSACNIPYFARTTREYEKGKPITRKCIKIVKNKNYQPG